MPKQEETDERWSRTTLVGDYMVIYGLVNDKYFIVIDGVPVEEGIVMDALFELLMEKELRESA